MRLTYNVKFNLNNKYEMHSMTWELEEGDLPSAARELGIEEKFRVMQAMALRQAALFQAAKGYVGKEEAAEMVKAAAAVLPKGVTLDG